MEEPSFWEFFKFLFKKRSRSFSEIKEEIEKFLDDLKKEGVLSLFEEKLILEIFSLRDLEVRDFTLPRSNLVGLEESCSWAKVKEIVSNHPHYFYPVYKETLDHFIGYISLKNLALGFNRSEFGWQKFIKPPLIVPENLSIMVAIEKLIEKNLKVAFVVDEWSELTGILCLKNVLEELIYSEKRPFHCDKEGWFLIPGHTKIRELEKCWGIELPKGDFETISGLIIHYLSRIPQEGEYFEIPPLQIQILRASPKKIEELKVKLKKEN
ncbi:MAG: CBS domain-containing protein [Thermodesulfobacteriaceae bacterium]|nr:CBS domain-containing protein [Thermodesulfobacteriaceae bacterium]MCX8042164.1 CBS domain-containing protein [Thermodesulfobacteriaceae bacterium]MDW8136519.1 transporter associated domain-containing protein [Thermodesulfobacterium sp.]